MLAITHSVVHRAVGVNGGDGGTGKVGAVPGAVDGIDGGGATKKAGYGGVVRDDEVGSAASFG